MLYILHVILYGILGGFGFTSPDGVAHVEDWTVEDVVKFVSPAVGDQQFIEKFREQVNIE